MNSKRKLFAVLCGTLLSLVVVFPWSSGASATQGPFNLVAWDSGKYVQLSWDADLDATAPAYNVYRSVKGPDSWEKLNKAPFLLTTFVDYSAPKSQLVFYRINYVNEKGEELSSSSVTAVSTSDNAALAQPEAVLAYDQNNIITDSQLTTANAMSAAEIQSFLTSQGSVLANYSTGGKTAAQHIYDNCQTHSISPYVVLVTLQKEKGLIKSGTANPNSFAMGWSTGDSSTADFANQIYYGTRQFRRYQDNLSSYGWTVGQAKAVSDGNVTAANTATAGLYVYTPWIGQGGGGQSGVGGNYLFWDLWYNTFGFGTSAPTVLPSSVLSPVVGPVKVTSSNLGILDGKWEFDQHQTGAHHPGGGIGGSDDTKAWDANWYKPTDSNADVGQPVYATAAGDVVSFAGVGLGNSCNAVLIAHPNKDAPEWWSGYLHLANYTVSLNQRVSSTTQIGTVGRACANNDHLHFVVYRGQNVAGGLISFNAGITERLSVDSCNNGSSEAFRINGGPPVHPNGTLIKVATNGTIYVLVNGQKRGITSETVLHNLYQQSNSNFDFKDVVTVASDEFNNYPTGSAVSSALPGNGRNQPDGRLISNPAGEVSIVTDGGGRRAFPSAGIFTNLGYLFCNVISVSSSEYNSYTPVGAVVDGTACVSPGSFSLSSPANGQSLSSTTSVTLSWGTSANASSYDVYFGTTSNPSFLANQTGTTRSVSVSPGQTYWWKVVAKVNCSSATSTAGIWSFSVQQSCNPPGTFSLSAPSNGQDLGPTTSVNLTWGGSASADSYDVYFGTSSNPSFIANQTGTSRSVSVSPGQTYWWKVVAKVNCGSATSTAGVWSFSVQICNAPGGFSLSFPSNAQSVSSTSSVSLQWNGSANADSYDLYFGTSSNPPFFSNQTGTFKAVSVTPGQTYWWKVVARVNCGSSTSTSAIWSFSVQLGCNPPGAFSLSSPSNGQSLPGSTTELTLSWDGSANADSYDVYFGTSTNPPFLANQTGTSRTVSITPGQTYYWKVVAKVNCGSSTTTAGIWSFSVGAPCNSPGAFSLSSPSNGQSLSSTTSVTLSWTGSAHSDSYDVYFGTSSNPPFVANQTATSREVNVTSGQTYWWKVVARIICGSATATAGEWSFSIAQGSPRTNFALAANGGVVSASSQFDAARGAIAATNGDRRGVHWGSDATTGSGWHSASTGQSWLEIAFNGARTIDEIDVFGPQDDYLNPVDPTLSLTFSLYGLTGFDVQYWNGSSWVTVPGGSVSGNNKVWRQFNFSAVSTTKIRVLTNSSPDGYSRLAEVEAWGGAAVPGRTNYALTAIGASVSASSQFDAARGALAATNGDRRGQHWGSDATTGSGWHSATTGQAWLEVAFNQLRTIDEIDVFEPQDDYLNPVDPTLSLTFSLYGLTGFDVQYWNGSSWVTVPGGSVGGNNKVWRQFYFSAVTTTKIRVLTNSSPDGYSRLTEVEAWGSAAPAGPTNFALAANGGVVSASSQFDAARGAIAATNGDRRGLHWGSDATTGSGWHSATTGQAWLEVAFNGARTIDEIDVFGPQDDYLNPVDPTLSLTFSLYGLTSFDVQYWNGSSWVTVPGGSVSGNNKVWRQFRFPAVSTTRIRVLTNGSPDGYSRLTEVEAYVITGGP